MADLNAVAKRLHNLSPGPMRLEFDDGTTGVFSFSSVEFFQQEFQGEATRADETDVEYRFTTTEDNEAVVVGRRGPDADGWELVGEVVAVERVEQG
jgi:hypothetical protein